MCLKRSLPQLGVPGTLACDALEILAPFGCKWDLLALLALCKSGRGECTVLQSLDGSVALKGSFHSTMLADGGEALLFSGMPHVKTLEDLSVYNVCISDLPTHSLCLNMAVQAVERRNLAKAMEVRGRRGPGSDDPTISSMRLKTSLFACPSG